VTAGSVLRPLDGMSRTHRSHEQDRCDGRTDRWSRTSAAAGQSNHRLQEPAARWLWPEEVSSCPWSSPADSWTLAGSFHAMR